MAGTTGTVAGRPQPQTTAEAAGGPFVRHAPDGRRAMYVDTQQFGGFMGRPMVSSPGWNKGYRVNITSTTNSGTGGVIAATAGGVDAPWSLAQLVQMKDAFGTQLLTGPGWDILYGVPKYGGQFGLDLMRDPKASPVWSGITAASGAFVATSYLPFEFAKGYGVISGANAALLPVLQVNLAAASTLFSTPPSVLPTLSETVDADFYWLPNVPADPPGIGTTEQWIYQPANPTIPSQASTLVQLPRLGGYLTGLMLDLRDSTGLRIDAYPARPKLLVDGVPLVDSLFTTLQEDMAIATGIGATVNGTQTSAGSAAVVRDTGILYISRKTSLSQRELGLLDTGEIFLSTNPGTQLEVAGYPWGTITNTPATLNAVVGQVVPSGALVRGLPEA
jgi:hypothetical protein